MEDILSVSVKKISGQPNPKEGKWSGVLDVEPSDPQPKKTRGRLFAVLDLTGSRALDLAGFGRQALETLEQSYFKADQEPPFVALEAAVRKARHRLVALIFGPGATIVDGSLDFNFSVCSLWGRVLHIAKLGSSGVYLYRRGAFKELGRDAGEEVFMASGMVEPRDSLILGSSEFRNCFSLPDFPKSDDDLEAQIRSLGSPPGVAALVLTFSLEAVPSDEEALRIEPVPKAPARFWLFGRIRRLLQPLGAGLFLAAFLLGSIYTIRERQNDFRQSETERLSAAAEGQLSDARRYIDLNNIRARELLLQAKSGFEEAKSVGGQVLGLAPKLSEIDVLLDQVNGVKRVEPEEAVAEAVSFDPLAGLTSPPEADESVVAVGAYLANVYFLVPSKNQIFKYVPVEEGYSLPQEWIKEGVDLSDAVSMAIDGFVYVLRVGGAVVKFEKGEIIKDFSLKELDQPLADPRAIFTTVDSGYLYILDAGNRRVVVFDKNGFYQSQYVYDDLETPIDPGDFAVDEEQGVIYLTDGGTLYRVEI